MGMYDSLFVKQDLPLPEEIKNFCDWKNHEFQTKDLDNCLGEYILNEYRELVEVIIEREYIPFTEEEKKSKDHRSWNIWKEVKEGATTYKDTNYHGTLNFYTYEHLDDDTDFWLDFKAYFVYGKLDKIDLTEFKKTTGHLAKRKEFEEKLAQAGKQPWSVFKHYASYLGWGWFWRKVTNFLYQISQTINSLRNFVFKYLL